jgi:hypothetical protein
MHSRHLAAHLWSIGQTTLAVKAHSALVLVLAPPLARVGLPARECQWDAPLAHRPPFLMLATSAVVARARVPVRLDLLSSNIATMQAQLRP